MSRCRNFDTRVEKARVLIYRTKLKLELHLVSLPNAVRKASP